MAESLVSAFRSLWTYLWTYVVERIGPLWWGVAIAAGLVTYALCSAHARRMGTGRGKALPAGLLVAYATIVIAATVLTRKVGVDRGTNRLIAGGVTNLLLGGRSNSDMFANAVMLLPIGFLLPIITGWRFSRTAIVCMAFSVWIETVQYICTLGYPELFDVALNTFGGVVGYGMWLLVVAIRSRGRRGDSPSSPKIAE